MIEVVSVHGHMKLVYVKIALFRRQRWGEGVVIIIVCTKKFY